MHRPLLAAILTLMATAANSTFAAEPTLNTALTPKSKRAKTDGSPQKWVAKNTSQKYVRIREVRSNCSCVNVSYNPSIVAPGQEVTINITPTHLAFQTDEDGNQTLIESTVHTWINYDTFANEKEALAPKTTSDQTTDFWTSVRDSFTEFNQPSAGQAKWALDLANKLTAKGATLPAGVATVLNEYNKRDEAGKKALLEQLGQATPDKWTRAAFYQYFATDMEAPKKTLTELGIRITEPPNSEPLNMLEWAPTETSTKKLLIETDSTKLRIVRLEIKGENSKNFAIETKSLSNSTTEASLTPKEGISETTRAYLEVAYASPKTMAAAQEKGTPIYAKATYFPLSKQIPVPLTITNPSGNPIKKVVWGAKEALTSKKIQVEVINPEHKLLREELIGLHSDRFEISRTPISDKTIEISITPKKDTEKWSSAEIKFTVSAKENQEITQKIGLNIKSRSNDDSEEKEDETQEPTPQNPTDIKK